ncbi:hypothetical protein CEXT_786121 [Caerostris extrusa]|uniref:Uncharacterized protein n=1 Tax=Caerostris extrusa TaxID=172846 RepID=A0AAV4VSC3_CAEEX|nr:hypothetical protein CEXT_786121 [Caerostris extrusa]
MGRKTTVDESSETEDVCDTMLIHQVQVQKTFFSGVERNKTLTHSSTHSYNKNNIALSAKQGRCEISKNKRKKKFLLKNFTCHLPRMDGNFQMEAQKFFFRQISLVQFGTVSEISRVFVESK